VPTLDFTDIIYDTDLSDVFDVIRRTETVSTATGRSSVTEEIITGLTGVVVPGDPGNIMRDESGQMTSRLITVTTDFRLRPASLNSQPDQVLYDGVPYTVKAVKLWTRLGPGFVKAVAESQRSYDPPP
jgi:hypothetical protein